MTDISVLMVCMGNICRSPMAEAVLRSMVAEAGLDAHVHIDSAGTHSYHLDHPPHDGTLRELERRGVSAGDGRSRLVTVDDFASFDLVVAMDRANVADMRALVEGSLTAPDARDAMERVSLLLHHADDAPDGACGDVPDPYYDGGFNHVFDLVSAGCQGLMEELRTRLAAPHPR